MRIFRYRQRLKSVTRVQHVKIVRVYVSFRVSELERIYEYVVLHSPFALDRLVRQGRVNLLLSIPRYHAREAPINLTRAMSHRQEFVARAVFPCMRSTAWNFFQIFLRFCHIWTVRSVIRVIRNLLKDTNGSAGGTTRPTCLDVRWK